MLHRNIRNLREVMRILFTWKREVFLASGIVAIATASYLLLAAPQYSTSAKIVLLPRSVEGSVITTGADDKGIAPVSMEDVNTEIEILKSNDVARVTVMKHRKDNHSLGLRPEPRWWMVPILEGTAKIKKKVFGDSLGNDSVSLLEKDVERVLKSLNVKALAASNIITVSLVCSDPAAGTRLLNRYCEEYIRMHNQIFTQEHGAQFLEHQKDTLSSILTGAQEQLSAFETEHHIVDRRVQIKNELDILADLESEIKEIDIQATQIKTRITLLQQALSQEALDFSLTEEMRSIPLLAELERALVPLLMRRSDLASRYTLSSREYRTIEKQIENTYLQRKAEIAKALDADAIELQLQQARKNSLRAKINERMLVINDLNQKSKVHEELLRTVEQNLDNYLLYSSKGEDARIISAKMSGNISNVTIADIADIPLEKSSPRRFLILILAGIIILVITLTLPLILEVFDNRLKTASDIETLLALPVLGTIMEKTEKQSSNDTSHGCAAIIRHLDFMCSTGKQKTFCFTPAAPGMGTSTALYSIFRVLQNMNSPLKTLFIDGDTVQATLSKLIGIQQRTGLLDLIRQTARPEESIITSHDSSISFLPPGNSPATGFPLPSREVISAWLDDCAKNYDLILMDVPCIADSLAATRLAASCDQTILVVASGASHLSATRRFLDTVKRDGVEISGALVTRYTHLIPEWIYNAI